MRDKVDFDKPLRRVRSGDTSKPAYEFLKMLHGCKHCYIIRPISSTGRNCRIVYQVDKFGFDAAGNRVCANVGVKLRRERKAIPQRKVSNKASSSMPADAINRVIDMLTKFAGQLDSFEERLDELDARFMRAAHKLNGAPNWAPSSSNFKSAEEKTA